MNYYWELICRDDTRYEIPPEAVEVVKRRMANKDAINLSSATIPYSEIKQFRVTDKRYAQQPLLEAAAHAFNEPMYNQDGSVIAKWVKKNVPQREYNKHYSHIQAYRRLGDTGSMVTVAFFLPVHDIDTNKVDYCTDDEIATLTRK